MKYLDLWFVKSLHTLARHWNPCIKNIFLSQYLIIAILCAKMSRVNKALISRCGPTYESADFFLFHSPSLFWRVCMCVCVWVRESVCLFSTKFFTYLWAATEIPFLLVRRLMKKALSSRSTLKNFLIFFFSLYFSLYLTLSIFHSIYLSFSLSLSISAKKCF